MPEASFFTEGQPTQELLVLNYAFLVVYYVYFAFLVPGRRGDSQSGSTSAPWVGGFPVWVSPAAGHATRPAARTRVLLPMAESRPQAPVPPRVRTESCYRDTPGQRGPGDRLRAPTICWSARIESTLRWAACSCLSRCALLSGLPDVLFLFHLVPCSQARHPHILGRARHIRDEHVWWPPDRWPRAGHAERLSAVSRGALCAE